MTSNHLNNLLQTSSPLHTPVDFFYLEKLTLSPGLLLGGTVFNATLTLILTVELLGRKLLTPVLQTCKLEHGGLEGQAKRTEVMLWASESHAAL